jgi:Ca-activated chloride channel family protein
MRATNYLDNFYARLGISRTASLDEIDQAYRNAAKRFHPDANKQPGAHELFLLIQEAFDTLSDRQKRWAYDSTLPSDIDAPPSIMVNALYSRGQITPGEPNQVIYVLLDLMASGLSGIDSRSPLNISLLLDCSTSMAGNRLNQVIKAANSCIEQLQPNDILSVVSFNDRAELVIPPQSGADIRRMQSKISTLQTGGGTEIFQGLQLGLQEIQRNLRTNYINHIVLITDGRTYGDEEASLRLAEQAANLGVAVSAIGIGEEWNENFIDQLVARGGGTSLYADRSSEVWKLLERRLNTISQVFANNVRLQFETGANAKLQYAFRLSPDLGALTTESPLALGAIPLETSLSVLMEFSLDAGKLKHGDLVLAEGELRLDIPRRAIPSTKARFRLSRPIQVSDEPEIPSQTLINAIGKLSLYRMQEQARQDIEAGDLVGAAKRMRMLATHLLSSGQKSLAQTVLLAADDIKHSGSLGEKVGKQIKYGTRALISEQETESTSSRRQSKQ